MSSPHGNNYHYADHVDSGTFAFTAAETGDYTACFWAPEHKPSTTVTIDFDWRTGVAAKDWSKVAKKGQIEVSNFIFEFGGICIFCIIEIICIVSFFWSLELIEWIEGSMILTPPMRVSACTQGQS